MSVKSPIHGSKVTSNVTTSRFDRICGLTGLAVAVATIGLGLLAQATGYEWLVWVAVGLVAVGLVGVVRNSIRYLSAYDRPGGFGWIVSSWLVIAVGVAVAVLVVGDSVGVFTWAGVHYLFASDIAVPSVTVGLAVGLTSVGLLRGRLRSVQRSNRLASGLMAVVGAGVLVGGVVAWLAPVTVGDLGREADVVETASGIFQVIEIPEESADSALEPMEVRAYGYEGTGDPATEGWDQWVVVAIDEDTGEDIEILYGPVSEEAASQYIGELDMASRTVLFEGTQAEVDNWLQEEGSGYKDYLVPAFLLWTGVLLVGSALTLSPGRRNAIAG